MGSQENIVGLVREAGDDRTEKGARWRQGRVAKSGAVVFEHDSDGADSKAADVGAVVDVHLERAHRYLQCVVEGMMVVVVVIVAITMVLVVMMMLMLVV